MTGTFELTVPQAEALATKFPRRRRLPIDLRWVDHGAVVATLHRSPGRVPPIRFDADGSATELA
jgi:hypothetical protein